LTIVAVTFNITNLPSPGLCIVLILTIAIDTLNMEQQRAT